MSQVASSCHQRVVADDACHVSRAGGERDITDDELVIAMEVLPSYLVASRRA